MKSLFAKPIFIFITVVIAGSFLVNYNLVYGQTKIAVVGTVHAQTKYINQDTLLNLLENFQPNIILLELDSTLIDKSGNFKTDPVKLSLETAVANAFQKKHPKVILGGIDVANRNSYYKNHDTFNKENKMGKLIDSLFKNNMLNDTSWFLASSIKSAGQILNNYGYLNIKEINSDNCMKIASLRQNLLYKQQVQMIRNNEQLKSWYDFAKENADFWDLRNRTMVDNIIAFSNKYPNKKILVLTGYFHKYALINGLKNKLKQSDGELIEIVF